MEKTNKYEPVIDIIIGCLIFGIIVNLTSNNLEPQIKAYLSDNYPKVPYLAVLILSAMIIIITFSLIKNAIRRKMQILNFELKDSNDSRRHLVNSLKHGKVDKHTIKTLLDSNKPSEMLAYIKLIRLKIGKCRSFKLAEKLYDMGKHHQNETHDLLTARDYFELATELYPEDPVYPNEAGSLSMMMKEYSRAKDFYQASVKIWRRKKKWRKGLAVAQNNLGISFLRLNQFDKALEYFMEARNTHLKVSKELSVYFIQNEINITSVYWKAGNFILALQILGDAEKRLNHVIINPDSLKEKNIYKLTCSEIPRKISEILLDLFLHDKKQVHLTNAMENAKLALSVDIENWGLHDEPTALSYLVLGKVYDAQNKKEEALKSYQKAYSFLAKIQIDNHEPKLHCEKRIMELKAVN